jgi:hypothetical protein
MKKRILLALVVVLGGTTLLMNGCKKDDETPPVVTPNQNSLTVRLGDAAPADPGASSDEGSVTSNWSTTNPNMGVAGNYTITYTATDDEGNVGTGTMTVRVKNDAEDYFSLGGTNYATSETPCSSNCTWNQSVKASTTVNNGIVFTYFAHYTDATVLGKITGTSIKVINISPASQNVTGVGTDGCNHTFADNGVGSPLTQVGGHWTFSVKFTDMTTGPGTGPCAPTSALPYEDTFVGL